MGVVVLSQPRLAGFLIREKSGPGRVKMLGPFQGGCSTPKNWGARRCSQEKLKSLAYPGFFGVPLFPEPNGLRAPGWSPFSPVGLLPFGRKSPAP